MIEGGEIPLIAGPQSDAPAGARSDAAANLTGQAAVGSRSWEESLHIFQGHAFGVPEGTGPGRALGMGAGSPNVSVGWRGFPP